VYQLSSEEYTIINLGKNFGQALRLLIGILNSYPISAMISDTRGNIVEKLDGKYGLVDVFIGGLKNVKSIDFRKINF